MDSTGTTEASVTLGELLDFLFHRDPAEPSEDGLLIGWYHANPRLWVATLVAVPSVVGLLFLFGRRPTVESIAAIILGVMSVAIVVIGVGGFLRGR